MNFADTNWLVALYLDPDPKDPEALQRRATVERYMRMHNSQLATSHVVLLEARNIFSHALGERLPTEWRDLEADFGGKLFVDPMNWHLLRRECDEIFSRHAWKIELGTFDVAILASAKLAGAKTLLSFDERLKVLAAAEGLQVFPALSKEGRALLAKFKRQ